MDDTRFCPSCKLSFPEDRRFCTTCYRQLEPTPKSQVTAAGVGGTGDLSQPDNKGLCWWCEKPLAEGLDLTDECPECEAPVIVDDEERAAARWIWQQIELRTDAKGNTIEDSVQYPLRIIVRELVALRSRVRELEDRMDEQQ